MHSSFLAEINIESPEAEDREFVVTTIDEGGEFDIDKLRTSRDH
jgi:hypothetical protein